MLKSLKDELKRLGLTPKQITKLVGDGKFYKAVGCHRCNDKGMKGRVGLYEALEVSKKIMELIVSNSTSVEIQGQALKEGMITMLQDGIVKAREGFTTLDEVLAATRE